VREQLHLKPGQDFEVFIDDEDTITLRRIYRPPNHGLVDHLLACPYPFEIPSRSKVSTCLPETSKFQTAAETFSDQSA